jgi:nicotinamide-nucleotide amidase
MFSSEIRELGERVLEKAREAGLRIVTAESCTGGLVAAALTDIPGSSDVVECGFVVYSDIAKSRLLNVPADMLERAGAVSEEVARAMATGALAASGAQLSVAITGVAGPTGGSALKPVGLVHFAAAREGRPLEHRECKFGDVGRGEVRMRSVETALRLMLRLL